MKQVQQTHYQGYYFANVSASLKRAPNSAADQIKEINGVNRVESRVQAGVNLDVPGFDETVTGMIISLPDEREFLLNRLYLREGWMPRPYVENEIVLGDGFAEEHGFITGDYREVVINGSVEQLRSQSWGTG